LAKKTRRKADEAAEEKAFDFPVFDEAAFAQKEFLLTWAVTFSSVIALTLGAFSWLCTSADLEWYVPFPIAFLVVIISPWLLGRLLPGSTLFTKGDWAGILALEFFGFVAVWFVLVNVA
jgi:hypothetical protein